MFSINCWDTDKVPTSPLPSVSSSPALSPPCGHGPRGHPRPRSAEAALAAAAQNWTLFGLCFINAKQSRSYHSVNTTCWSGAWPTHNAPTISSVCVKQPVRSWHWFITCHCFQQLRTCCRPAALLKNAMYREVALFYHGCCTLLWVCIKNKSILIRIRLDSDLRSFFGEPTFSPFLQLKGFQVSPAARAAAAAYMCLL